MNKLAAKVETGPAFEIPNAPTLERTAPEVITLRFPDVAAGFTQWIMLSSDHHWDNPLCDRALLKSHLDKAKERDALYFAYDYKKLLEDNYFKNIKITKIPESVWPNEPWKTFGYVITCVR